MVVVNFFRGLFFLALLVFLLLSCAVKDFDNGYVPPQGSLQSLYPYQINKKPKTPIERVQIGSRDKGGFEYICFNGGVTITIIDGVARMSYKDKKKWPSYGRLTAPVKTDLAADGSVNHSLIFSIEAYDQSDRHVPSNMWSENIYMLTWNIEDENYNKFDAELEIRANAIYQNGKAVEIHPIGKSGIEFYCGSFSDEMTLRKAMAVFAVETLTPEQKQVWEN